MGKNGSCVISADLTTPLYVYNPYLSGEVSGIVGIVLIIFTPILVYSIYEWIYCLLHNLVWTPDHCDFTVNDSFLLKDCFLFHLTDPFPNFLFVVLVHWHFLPELFFSLKFPGSSAPSAPYILQLGWQWPSRTKWKKNWKLTQYLLYLSIIHSLNVHYLLLPNENNTIYEIHFSRSVWQQTCFQLYYFNKLSGGLHHFQLFEKITVFQNME